MKKYGPYLILIAGALLSIVLAFVSIRSFGGPSNEELTATSTEQGTTTVAVAQPKKRGFFDIFGWMTNFGAFAPRIPTATPGGSTGGEEAVPEPSPENTYPVTPEPSKTSDGFESGNPLPSEGVALPVDEYYGEQPSRRPHLAPGEAPYVNKVFMQHQVSTGSGDPAYETLVIYAPAENTAPYRITGLRFQSAITSNTATIGDGVHLYFQNQPNVKQDIYLKPGNYAYIITGASPIGVSFELNKCIGYLSQGITFHPGIGTNCPGIEEKDLPKYPNHLEDACLNYIPWIGRCRHPSLDEIPEELSQECKNFVIQKLTYPMCVSGHQYDTDFYLGEWRIYLNRSQELWKTQREHIRLFDQNGKVLDEFSY